MTSLQHLQRAHWRHLVSQVCPPLLWTSCLFHCYCYCFGTQTGFLFFIQSHWLECSYTEKELLACHKAWVLIAKSFTSVNVIFPTKHLHSTLTERSWFSSHVLCISCINTGSSSFCGLPQLNLPGAQSLHYKRSVGRGGRQDEIRLKICYSVGKHKCWFRFTSNLQFRAPPNWPVVGLDLWTPCNAAPDLINAFGGLD